MRCYAPRLNAAPAAAAAAAAATCLQATLNFITQKGDATLDDIMRFIKETVRQGGGGWRGQGEAGWQRGGVG
jgi:hypothetical protein